MLSTNPVHFVPFHMHKVLNPAPESYRPQELYGQTRSVMETTFSPGELELIVFSSPPTANELSNAEFRTSPMSVQRLWWSTRLNRVSKTTSRG